MTSTTRVPRTEITGLFGAMVKKFSRRMFGVVPEGVEVMWHYPAVFRDTMGFGRKVDKWRRLDRNLASFAAMAAAGVVGLVPAARRPIEGADKLAAFLTAQVVRASAELAGAPGGSTARPAPGSTSTASSPPRSA